MTDTLQRWLAGSHLAQPSVLQRRMRILQAMIKVMMPLAVVAGLAFAYDELLLGTTWELADLVPFAIAAGLVPAYLLGRRDRYVPAAVTTIVAMFLGIWAIHLFNLDADQHFFLVFFVAPIFLASVLLTSRATALVAGASIALAAWGTLTLGSPLAVPIVLFLSLISVLVGVGSALRERDLEQIETQTRKLEESQERLSEAQAIGRMGSWELDLDTMKFTWSDQLYRITDRSPKTFDPTFANFVDIVHPDDIDRVQETLQEVIAEKVTADLDIRVRHVDGSWRWIHVRGQPVLDDDGEPFRVVGIAQDITDRRRLEELERRRSSDQARLGELQQLTRLTSHSFREPLRNIAGYGKLLARSADADEDPDADEYAAHLQDAVQQLEAIIRDFSRYTEIQAREPRPADVDLGDAVTDVQRELTTELTAREIQVDVGEMPTVRADPYQVRELLRQLLENAVQHAGEGAHVEVQARRDGGEWIVTVADDGPGIDPEYHERVFEVFRQLDPGGGDSTGIGLALSKRIVEQNGGRIWVDSKPGDGAAFRFALPAVEGRGEG